MEIKVLGPLLMHFVMVISALTGAAGAGDRPNIIDIMATCVDICGMTYPAQYKGATITPMQGKSLVPTFSGHTLDRDSLYFEHEGNRAIRKGKWTLVTKGAAGPK
jgi:arylsulfatase A-like enzyme